MHNQLTQLQAFRAMIKFLDNYYEKKPSDDLGLLLGEMQLQDDNKPADSATWSYWIDSINKVTHQTNNQQNNASIDLHNTLSSLEIFKAMIDFLEVYRDQIKSDDIQVILNDLLLSSNNKIMNTMTKHKWLESVNYILNDQDPTYGYFQIFR